MEKRKAAIPAQEREASSNIKLIIIAVGYSIPTSCLHGFSLVSLTQTKGLARWLRNKKALVISLTIRVLYPIPGDPMWWKKRADIHMYVMVHVCTYTCGDT